MTTISYNRVEIDLGALRHNFRLLRERAGRARILAVVKSDAYGHGLVRCARTLEAAGAEAFAIAEVDEGVALRQAGIAAEIVVMLGVPPAAIDAVVEHRLTPVVFGLEGLAELSERAVAAGSRVEVHLKVDVGMGRLGVRPQEVGQLVAAVEGLPGLHLAGILAQLPMADATAPEDSLVRLQHFRDLVASLEAASGRRWLHLANSAALLRFPDARFDMVRPGIALYGCQPLAPSLLAEPLALRPAMAFKTEVVQVKEVPAGFGISYGHTFVTERPSRLAILPVGYDDGYLRRLSNRAEVLLGGQRAPVRGTVCMNACVVDVSDLPPVAVGDEVVLLGRQGDEEITAAEVAAWMETIHYEVLCLFGSCNQRIYFD